MHQHRDRNATQGQQPNREAVCWDGIAPRPWGRMEMLTWKPCTKIRTVSPTRALVGVIVIFGPLGATAREEDKEGREPSEGLWVRGLGWGLITV